MNKLKKQSQTEIGEQQHHTVIRVYSDHEEISLSRVSGHIMMLSHPVKIKDLDTIVIDEKGKIVDYTLISDRGKHWAKRAEEGSK